MTNTHPLYFVTTSAWKYQQGKEFLERHGVSLEQAKIELPESRSEDVLEVAKGKAAFAYEQLRKPIIIIDGAFHIKALNGFPKTFVKFAEKYVGAAGVLRLMESVDKRSYEWPNVLVYRDDKMEKHFVGYIRGQIVKSIPSDLQGNDFGLIQLPDGYDKTFGQMTKEELHHFETNVWQPALFDAFAKWYSKAK